MSLYYSARIRETVLKRWAEDRIPNMESGIESNLPESDIAPHEEYAFKDMKIPIAFKVAISHELYENETETIKADVRSKREALGPIAKTVHNTNGSERMALIHEYQQYVCSLLHSYPRSNAFSPRNIPVLGRSILNVLKNSERKCAAQGITWLACPTPLNGGKPVAFL